MVNSSQQGKVMAAFLTSVRTSQKAPIYTNKALSILKQWALYTQILTVYTTHHTQANDAPDWLTTSHATVLVIKFSISYIL